MPAMSASAKLPIHSRTKLKKIWPNCAAEIAGAADSRAHCRDIQPRDTFVLFAAARGTTFNGRFYLIPQDYDGGTNPDSLQQRAMPPPRDATLRSQEGCGGQ